MNSTDLRKTMGLKTGDIVYAIVNNNLVEVEFVKYSKKSERGLFKIKGKEHPQLIELWWVFLKKEEAEKVQNHRLAEQEKDRQRREKIEEKKRIEYEKEREEIMKIVDKIWHEFDIEIPFLSQPYTIEDAHRLYRKLKSEHESA